MSIQKTHKLNGVHSLCGKKVLSCITTSKIEDVNCIRCLRKFNKEEQSNANSKKNR